MISEKVLIEQCALTLSGIKVANLFTVRFSKKEILYNDIKFWNNKFKNTDIKIVLLKVSSNSALIYMYRNEMLKNDLKDAKAKEILSSYGYGDLSVLMAINNLSKRLHQSDEFPHEIGLFLGYPTQDVEGFICHKGKDCNLCGYWKVYGDTKEALQKFARYDKCKAMYKKLWEDGRDIMQLTVKKRYAA